MGAPWRSEDEIIRMVQEVTLGRFFAQHFSYKEIAKRHGVHKRTVVKTMARYDGKRANPRVGQVLQAKSFDLQDECSFGGGGKRRPGHAGECPERTFLTPLQGLGVGRGGEGQA